MPDAPVASAPVQETESSPALQIIGKMKDKLMGRAIGLLIKEEGTNGLRVKFNQWSSMTSFAWLL
jgi:catalase